MADEGQLFVAKESANFDVDGSPVWIGKGTIVRAGHPILVGREHLFEPLHVHYENAPPARSKGEDAAPKSQSRADQQEARSR